VTSARMSLKGRLSPLERRQLRQLHRLDPRGNWAALAFFGLWSGTACALWNATSPGTLAGGVGASSVAIHGLLNLMHDGIHGNLLRSRRWNYLLQFLCGAPSLLSTTAFRLLHVRHHRFLRTAADPDEPGNISRSAWITTAAMLGILLGGGMFSSVRVPIVAWQWADPAERRRIVLETAAVWLLAIAACGLAIRSGQTTQAMLFFLLPWYGAGFIAASRGMFEHSLAAPDAAGLEARTVTSNRWLSLLNVNMNYHVEHHLFPGVPWYNLPRLHRLLRPHYVPAEGHESRGSYLRLVLDMLLGRLAFRPPPNPSPGLRVFAAPSDASEIPHPSHRHSA